MVGQNIQKPAATSVFIDTVPDLYLTGNARIETARMMTARIASSIITSRRRSAVDQNPVKAPRAGKGQHGKRAQRYSECCLQGTGYCGNSAAARINHARGAIAAHAFRMLRMLPM
jgi:hypothetical protein